MLSVGITPTPPLSPHICLSGFRVKTAITARPMSYRDDDVPMKFQYESVY